MALGFIGDIVGEIASSLYSSLPTKITDLYETQLPQIGSPDITFQPFTVTGPGGSQVTTTADGSTAYALSPEQQAMQQQLFGGAGSMFGQAISPLSYGTPGAQAMQLGQQMLGQTPYGLTGIQDASGQAFGLGSQFMQQAGMGTADREAAIYERIRAAQTPEEARERAALEERLAAQGRLGVRTNQFGGTPEQLALAKAQAEAQNTAMLGAMRQAQAEQAQQAGLGAQYAGLGAGLAGQGQQLTGTQQAQALQALQAGQGLNLAELQQALAQQAQQAQLGGQFLQQSYAPQAALLSMMSPALNVADLADVARRQQGEFDLETALANLQGEMGQRAGLANLYGNLFSGATGMAGGFGKGLLDILGF